MKVCIEFDGCIYPAGRIDNGKLTGPPVKGAFEYLEDLLNLGHTLFISTARFNADEDNMKLVMEWINEHCPSLITRIQTAKEESAARCFLTGFKPAADVYIDPKGFRFEGKWPSISILQSL